jgi:hypothetical protein
LLSGCHDGVHCFGSDLSFEERLQRFGGNVLVDPELLIPWLRTARDLRAIEMESAGVYRAVRGRCPMLAIRGISDIVGLKTIRRLDKVRMCVGRGVHACVSAHATGRGPFVAPASLPKPAGLIDFTAERARHARFVGRAALLAQLDRLLIEKPADRWVVVTGGPGMGKSALLAQWLARREVVGAPVPHHFRISQHL